jgi:hypothetical protein
VRPVRKAKKPALRRAEARERLLEVTDVSNITAVAGASRNGPDEVKPDVETRTDEVKPDVETRSVLEREWYALT